MFGRCAGQGPLGGKGVGVWRGGVLCLHLWGIYMLGVGEEGAFCLSTLSFKPMISCEHLIHLHVCLELHKTGDKHYQSHSGCCGCCPAKIAVLQTASCLPARNASTCTRSPYQNAFEGLAICDICSGI